MPAILLKAQTGTTKSRREGNKTIVEKTVEKGVLTETHTDTSHRLKGKQSAKQTVTLSAAEIKAFDKGNDEKIEKGLRAGKAGAAKTLAGMNAQANKLVGQLEAAHRAELKVMADKVARTEAGLAAMVGARRERREKKEEKKKGGTAG